MAYPLTEVGPDAVGGSEQILVSLDHALTGAGHRSIVIAAEGSKIEGTLLPSPMAEGLLNDTLRDWGRRVHRQLIKDALSRFDVDLIHMHSLDFHTYLPACSAPLLATLHLPADWYPKEIFQLKRPRFYMNCVSESQHASCPPSNHLLPHIGNGVDVARLGCDVPKSDFALTMGRICPEKGFHFALDVARDTGTRLVLAGEVFPIESHLHYFKTEIEPRLDDLRTFAGPLSFAKKRITLAEAKCLVIPSIVAETSSLVAMEAMACGTPVIAMRSGALPEIVDHGLTGFVVSNTAEMRQALLDIGSISPEVCRQVANTRFSSTKMAAKYLQLYESLIERDAKIPVQNCVDRVWASSGLS